MKRINERDKLSIAQCRKILGKEYQHLTDEEIVKVRDWIYQVSELTVKFIQDKSPDELSVMESKLTSNRNKNEQKESDEP